MRKINLFFILIHVSILSSLATANTIVQQRFNALPSLIDLKKITIGPDDSYQGVLHNNPNPPQIFYTKNSNMASQVHRQDIKTGLSSNFINMDVDSKDPAISENGDLLSFTYFKDDALGDICYKKIGHTNTTSYDDDIKCITRKNSHESSPQWVHSNKIFFISEKSADAYKQIISYDIQTKEASVVHSGEIAYYAISSNGQYLCYNEKNNSSSFTIIRLSDKKSFQLNFNLPGIAGLPRFSLDGQYLYWAQFLNDTNHDQVIDGNDYGLIFRLPQEQFFPDSITSIASITSITSNQIYNKNQHNIIPEQLTSVETNCSYPIPATNSLYITCAFEGSLDIYELPLSGIIPTSWGMKELLEAHQVARNYGERLLILNTIAYKIEKKYTLDLLKRIYADHLHLKEYTSVIFYGKLISQQLNNQSEKNRYYLLEAFFDIIGLYQQEPLGQITANFQIKVKNNLFKVNTIRGQDSLKILIKSYFDFLIKNYTSAKTTFASIDYKNLKSAIELHIYFELAQKLNQESPKNEMTKMTKMAEIKKYYLQMITSPYLQDEELLFYAFSYVNYLQDEISKRIENLQQIIVVLANNHILKYFFSAEIFTLQIINAPDNSQQEKDAYQKLDQLITEQRNNFFLRKTISIRSILNLMSAGKINYAHYLSTNWIRFTKKEEMEFKQAQTQYSFNILNKAYQFINEKKLNYALNNFYGALTLTDDLESHYGHVSMLWELRGEENASKELDERYQNLLKREFIKENYTYVSSLINTLKLQKSDQKKDDSNYLKIINELENFPSNQNSPMRYLLIGYCYSQLLRNNHNQQKISSNLFANYLQQAHRNLMLSFDLAQDNFRVRSSALSNLGLIHYLAHNYSLSAKFFNLRDKFPFPTIEGTKQEEKIAFLWFYSKSLFYANNYSESKLQIEKAIALEKTLNLPISWKLPLLERKAFLSLYTNDFDGAISQYQNILNLVANIKEEVSESNLAKINLSLGYAYFKKDNKEGNDAFKYLNSAKEMFLKLSSQSQSSQSYNRQLLIIYGLLSQLNTKNNLNNNLNYKTLRLNLLDDIYTGKISIQMNQNYVLTSLTKEWAQLASMQIKNGDQKSADHSMSLSIEKLLELSKKISLSNYNIYSGLKAHLLYAIYTKIKENTYVKIVSELYNKTITHYQNEIEKSTSLIQQEDELKNLWSKLQNKK
ncbi:MAG: hypothetical protein HQK49_04035 [Oligoflexia bacterium]|nr:hypothetical protein [Oligoflexia bacterium]